MVEGVTGIDNYYRVGVFIDALKRGDSPADAAELARTIGYDYSALTDFERTVMRRAFMFYSFMRKNMDLFWYTLTRHPERIAGQLRLIHGIHNAYMEDEPELTLRDFQKLRLPVYIRKSISEAHGKPKVHPNSHIVSQTMWIAPPLPAMDAIGFWVDMFDAMGSLGKDKEALGQMMARGNIYVTSLAEHYAGKSFFDGRELDSPTKNMVPAWMVELDRSLTGGQLVDDILKVAIETEPDPSRDEYPGAGTWHSRNPAALLFMKNILQIPGFGRSMDTITAMDRANVDPFEAFVRASENLRRNPETGEHKIYLGSPGLIREPGQTTAEPRAGLSELEEFWGLFGFKPYDVQTEMAAWERVHKAQAAQMAEESKKLERSDLTRGMERRVEP
jgi:hypothetical protein